MDKKIILQSVINAILSWLLVALIISLKNQIGFGDALIRPYTIIIAVAAGVASFFGFMMRKKK